MSHKIFVNLPVKDLGRSMTFYKRLGFTLNPRFTDETAACMVLSDDIYAMLLTHAKFRQFTSKEIADAHKAQEALIALSFGGRTEVDRFADTALEAGAKAAREPEDLGFMYVRAIEDLDGHVWEAFWMDPAAVGETPANRDRKSAIPDEREIRTQAEAWSRALEKRDLDKLMANYKPDVQVFDVTPPYKTEGRAAYRKLWESCLPAFPARFKSEHRDFTVTAGDTVAFAHGLHRIVPVGEKGDGGADTPWFRVTVCYEKNEGRWQVAHEHVSAPFDPATDKVAPIRDPAVAA